MMKKVLTVLFLHRESKEEIGRDHDLLWGTDQWQEEHHPPDL
jgi:hypothetical protein